MKKSYKYIVLVIILLFIIYLGYSYLNISGSQIDGVEEISSTSSVTLTKRHFSDGKSTDYVLNNEQIEMLKDLIIETNFRKVLSSKVYSNDAEYYTIVVNDSEKGLIISFLGGEYISVAFQFNGKYLKIKNPEW